MGRPGAHPAGPTGGASCGVVPGPAATNPGSGRAARCRGAPRPGAPRAAPGGAPPRGRAGPSHVDRLPHRRSPPHRSAARRPPRPRHRHRFTGSGVRRHRAVARCLAAASPTGGLPRRRAGPPHCRCAPPARRGVRRFRRAAARRARGRCQGGRAGRGAARPRAGRLGPEARRGEAHHRRRTPTAARAGAGRTAQPVHPPRAALGGHDHSGRREADPGARRRTGGRGCSPATGRPRHAPSREGYRSRGGHRTLDAAHGCVAGGSARPRPATGAPARHHPLGLPGVPAVAAGPRHPWSHRHGCAVGDVLGPAVVDDSARRPGAACHRTGRPRPEPRDE